MLSDGEEAGAEADTVADTTPGDTEDGAPPDEGPAVAAPAPTVAAVAWHLALPPKRQGRRRTVNQKRRAPLERSQGMTW